MRFGARGNFAHCNPEAALTGSGVDAAMEAVKAGLKMWADAGQMAQKGKSQGSSSNPFMNISNIFQDIASKQA